jgi:hypothetical protein
MHGLYEHSEFISGGPWLVVVVLAGLGGLGIIIWLLFRNRWRGTSSLTRDTDQKPSTEGALSWEEQTILALVRQNGGPMSQSEIAGCLPMIGADEIAKALKSLETMKLAGRKWDAEKKTFNVAPI